MKYKVFQFTILIFLFQTALAQEENFLTFIKKANNALSNSDYTEALTNFNAAFQKELPDSSVVAWNAGLAGICAEESQNEDKAIEYFKLAMAYKTQDTDIYDRLLALAKKNNDISLEEMVLISLKNNFPEKASKYNSKLLYVYFNSQQYEKAIAVVNELLADEPQSNNIMYMKAVAMHKTGQTDLAMEDLAQILTTEPNNVKANSMLGIIYYQKAEKRFNKLTDNYNNLKDPDRVDYWHYTKEILTCNPDYKKAITYLTIAYEKEPNDVLRAAIYNSYIRLEQKDKAYKYKN